MNQTTFFSMEPINSVTYWDKRVSEFALLKGISKRERESFWLEFFISAYLDNKSKIARKLIVPFNEVIFDNPNAPIIEKIVQQYNFYDSKELKRVAEGFYHYYRIFRFWNEYWTNNYVEQCKNCDKRFLTRCALTFLTLSYPASYCSYMERNSKSTFFLFDDRVKGLGFSSIASLLKCSVLFCKPGTKLAFPWDPRNLDNPNLIWNQRGTQEYFEDFQEVLGNFIHSGYSMRHEDYSLLIKIQNGVLPLQYSWRRNSTNETLHDKQAINNLIIEYSNNPIQTYSSSAIEDNSPATNSLNQEIEDKYTEQIILLIETVFIIEDLVLNKTLPSDEKNNDLENLKVELKSILKIVTNMESEVSSEFLSLANTHLEKLYIQLQKSVTHREKKETVISSDLDVISEMESCSPLEEDRNQMQYAQTQQSQILDSQKQQDNKYSLLKSQYLKQSTLLSNALEQNRKLRNQLQERIPIDLTRKALSKYFSTTSIDRLIEHLKKN